MKRIVKIECPYCGKKIAIEHDSLYSDYAVVICDVMEGGCDKPFVADVRVSIEATAMKIEGAT